MLDDAVAEVERALGAAADLIWGPWLLVPLLLATGGYLTVVLRGIQFRKLGPALWLGLVRRKEADGAGDVSHFQALMVALAATVGVGNIAGVGTAIALGGPGALFWMWLTGLLGMATKYAEGYLGVRYRRVDAAGERTGGPMYYLSDGLRERFGPRAGRVGTVLALGYAAAGAVAAFGIGNLVQANTVADVVDQQWGVASWQTGVLLALLASLPILGGIRAIARFAAGLVPAMALLYLLAAAAVLLGHVTDLPGALSLIVSDAATGTAAVGGFAGAGVLAAVRYGVARGIFSNESGLGTGGIAAAAAKTTHEVRQALVSMTQTFLDTIVVVSATGLVIVVTGAWRALDPRTGEGLTGAPLTTAAFRDGLPGDWGGGVVSLGVVLFAFSTLLGWAYYGERCLSRLAGRSWVPPYRVAFCLAIVVGASTQLTVVWSLADALNGLMALPNLVGLVLLSMVVAGGTRAYFRRSRDYLGDWRSSRANNP